MTPYSENSKTIVQNFLQKETTVILPQIFTKNDIRVATLNRVATMPSFYKASDSLEAKIARERKYANDYLAANREKINERRRQWYEDNKERQKLINKEYREENKAKEAERHKKYNEQLYTCEVCNKSLRLKNKARHELSQSHQNRL